MALTYQSRARPVSHPRIASATSSSAAAPNARHRLLSAHRRIGASGAPQTFASRCEGAFGRRPLELVAPVPDLLLGLFRGLQATIGQASSIRRAIIWTMSGENSRAAWPSCASTPNFTAPCR